MNWQDGQKKKNAHLTISSNKLFLTPVAVAAVAAATVIMKDSSNNNNNKANAMRLEIAEVAVVQMDKKCCWKNQT